MNHMPRNFDRQFKDFVSLNDVVDDPRIKEAIDANVVKWELLDPITKEANTDSWAYYNKETGKRICNTTATHRIGDATHGEAIPRWMEAVERTDKDAKFRINHVDDSSKIQLTAWLPNQTYNVMSLKIGDDIGMFALYRNAYDSMWSLQTNVHQKRILCMNGMVAVDKIAGTTQKHKGNINAGIGINTMQMGADTFLANRDMYNNWCNERISFDDAEIVLNKLCKDKHTYTRKYKDDTNKSKLETLMRIYRDQTQELGENKWALYNALTFWSSHPDKTGDARQSTLNDGAKLINASDRRDVQVAALLRKTNNLELVGS